MTGNEQYLWSGGIALICSSLLISLTHSVGNCVSLLQGFQDCKSGIKYPASRVSFLRMADFRVTCGLFTWLVYIHSYCVPMAILNQGKRSQKLHLGVMLLSLERHWAY